MGPRKSGWIIFAALCFVVGCTASDEWPVTAEDQSEILETVDAFFVALATGDADTIEAMFSEEAITVSVRPDDPAQPPTRAQAADLVVGMRSGQFPRVVEPYWAPTVMQRGPLAVVWTPYEVGVDGNLIHCGIDVFNMSREEGRWKIDAISWTSEPSACEELWPKDKNTFRPQFPKGE